MRHGGAHGRSALVLCCGLGLLALGCGGDGGEDEQPAQVCVPGSACLPGTGAGQSPIAAGDLGQVVGGDRPAMAPRDLFQDGSAASGCDPALAGLLGDTPLRRLTTTQYESTVQDLFGVMGIAVPAEVGDDIPGDALAGAFPSNDRVAPSENHVRAYQSAAETVAAAVTAPGNIELLVPQCAPAVGDAGCAQAFIQEFASRAFRRPVAQDQIDGLMTVFNAAAGSGFPAGIGLVVEAVLQSPEFLYQVESKLPGTGSALMLDPHEIASRLSYFLWNSVPDAELTRAANAGELADPIALRAQAERMLADPKGERAVRLFTFHWLALGQAAVQVVDPATYPAYSGPAFNQAAIEETHAFMQHLLRGAGSGTLSELFTASYGFPTQELAGVYGVGGDGATPQQLTERAGVLTQPGFLLAHSDPEFRTTAIKRGATVVNNFLCYDITFPDNLDIDLNIASPAPGRSARQILEDHTRDPVCQGCHAAFNPVGFAFDRYDAIGGIRDADPFGNPLTDEAVLAVGDAAIDGPVKGPIELGQRLAGSDGAKSCMVRQMYRFALTRNETDADTCTLVDIAQRFEASGFDIRQLMFDIATSDGFTKRPNG